MRRRSALRLGGATLVGFLGAAYELYAHVPASDDDPPVSADLVEAAGDQSCITVGMDIDTARIDDEDVPSVAYGTIGECRGSD